ncbi:hypothetical protein ASZ90_010182 [hydrocarbon metagenome]|uniref:PGF-CTERM sorting domain-containing protein n=1 Tax=hydrocarbon metagenome TaxID=938273 RepID=A0A0W8FGR6_9ZZZZ|nr:hypothetical protein [Methanomicrobiaceae archaeon]
MPGDEITVGEEAAAFDISALRNETTGSAVTELRYYEGDVATEDPVHTVDVTDDTNVALAAGDFEPLLGEGPYFGEYHAYSGDDDALTGNTVTIMEGPTMTPEATPAEEETPADNVTPGATPIPVVPVTDNVTPTPMETPTLEETPTPMETPTEEETPTPMETPTEEETPAPGETPTPEEVEPVPLSITAVIGALAIAGLSILMRKKR